MAVNASLIKAIEALDYRVTPGDVATQAGMDVKLAERDLVALAADAGAHIQVASSGDVAYLFPQDFRAILRNKVLRLRLQAWWQGIWNILFYLIRISFGIVLLLSILLLAIAVIAIVIISLKGSQQDDDRDRPSMGWPSGRSSGHGGGMLYNWQLSRMISMCFDLFFNYSYYRPVYRRPSSEGSIQRRSTTSLTNAPRSNTPQSKSELNFLESIFSFLFGDGDPNADLETIRWQTIGAVIRNHQGAIAAEQVVPYLDEPEGGWGTDDEDYILPVLTRFDGRPAVSPAGQLVYHFPDLQVTAANTARQPVPDYLQEKRWPFSQATQGQITGAIFLGLVNLFLLFIVGQYAFDGDIVQALREAGLAFILWLYPFLAAYGVGFLGIPGLRYFWLQRRNTKVDSRNRERQSQAQRLEQTTPELQSKLTYARQFAAKTIINSQNVVYSTESDLLEQEFSQLADSPE